MALHKDSRCNATESLPQPPKHQLRLCLVPLSPPLPPTPHFSLLLPLARCPLSSGPQWVIASESSSGQVTDVVGDCNGADSASDCDVDCAVDCRLQLQLRRAMTSPSRHVWKLHTIINRLYSCRDISRTHPFQLPGRRIPCSRVNKASTQKEN